MVIGEATEKQVCELLGAEHVGGPGQPDCRLGALIVVEVKDHQRPIDAGVVRRVVARPWAQGRPVIFVSRSGFTKPAIRLIAERPETFAYHLLAERLLVVWPPDAESRGRTRQAPCEPPCSRPSLLSRVLTGVAVATGLLVISAVAIRSAGKPMP